MPFRLTDAASGAAEAARRGPARALGNPLVAALVVTVIALVVFLECLKGEDYPKPDMRTKARAGLYAFLATTAVLATHYYMIDRTLRDKLGAERGSSAVDRVLGGRDGAYGVVPSHHVRVEPGSIFSDRGAYAPDPYGDERNPYGARGDAPGARGDAPGARADAQDPRGAPGAARDARLALAEPDLNF